MSQKPISMEQLKQILQLKNDGVAIRHNYPFTKGSERQLKTTETRMNSEHSA